LGRVSIEERRAVVDVARESNEGNDIFIVGEGDEVYAGFGEDYIRQGFGALKKVGNDGAKAPD